MISSLHLKMGLLSLIYLCPAFLVDQRSAVALQTSIPADAFEGWRDLEELLLQSSFFVEAVTEFDVRRGPRAGEKWEDVARVRKIGANWMFEDSIAGADRRIVRGPAHDFQIRRGTVDSSWYVAAFTKRGEAIEPWIQYIADAEMILMTPFAYRRMNYAEIFKGDAVEVTAVRPNVENDQWVDIEFHYHPEKAKTTGRQPFGSKTLVAATFDKSNSWRVVRTRFTQFDKNEDTKKVGSYVIECSYDESGRLTNETNTNTDPDGQISLVVNRVISSMPEVPRAADFLIATYGITVEEPKPRFWQSIAFWFLVLGTLAVLIGIYLRRTSK